MCMYLKFGGVFPPVNLSHVNLILRLARRTLKSRWKMSSPTGGIVSRINFNWLDTGRSGTSDKQLAEGKKPTRTQPAGLVEEW